MPIDLAVEGKGVPLAHLTACQVVEVAQQPRFVPKSVSKPAMLPPMSGNVR